MVKFVFDLDLTLYSEHDCDDSLPIEQYYESFRPKPGLKKLLTTIPYPKYILTNATFAHAIDVLNRLGIYSKFRKIISADMTNSLKPSLPIYQKAITEFQIGPRERVIFFEDQPINLQSAKDHLGWQTVLICPTKGKKPEGVDFLFSTIEEALTFFVVKDRVKPKEL